MAEEVKDVNEEVVNPQENVEAGSSPEGTPQESESATPQKAVTQKEEKIGFGDPEHPDHERFMELMNEKKRTEEQNRQLLEMLQRQQQVPQQQQVQMPAVDELAHLPPEDQVFYRNLDARYERKTKQLLDQKEKQFQNALQAQQAVISNLLTRDFRRTHPEIEVGSQEEQRAAQFIQRGYDPDDAAKLAMYDKLQENAQVKAKQTQQQRTQAKRQANVEGASTPPQSGLPPKKESFRDVAGKLYDEEQQKGWE